MQCACTRLKFLRKSWRFRHELLNSHFLRNKNTRLKKLYSAFRDIIGYIWTKFEQNPFLGCGREISKMIDFYLHALLSMRVFETRTASGSVLFSLLTCFCTTTFILLSIFSLLEMISIKSWGDTTVLAREMFFSGCRQRLKNARA